MFQQSSNSLVEKTVLLWTKVTRTEKMNLKEKLNIQEYTALNKLKWLNCVKPYKWNAIRQLPFVT